ncbi:MAG: phage tail tape measure protein, partial [Chloroflexi bacterium]|nr:phage tail tape measure protein [Chloroflexota bacterium]
ALSGIGDSLSNLGSRCKALGSTLTLGLTAPLVAVGGGAIKMAADFETAMNNVNSIAFLPQAQLKALGQSVIDLSKTVPQGPEVLAKALYDIYSSGFQGKEALDVLNSSAQAASAGMTDAFTSGKALMAVINSYPKGMYDAKTASDLLFQTVNLGVLTFEELASQIGDVLPTAATTGVSLKEIGAALATMTRGGISAAESVTALNQMLLSYIDPSDEAIGLANKLGIEFNVQAIQAKGLAGVMNDLASKVGLYEVVSTGADAAIKAQVTSIKEQILALDQQAAALGPPTKANKALRDAISDQKEALNLQRRELLMAKDANIDYNVVLAEMSKRTGLQAEQLAILFPNVRALKAALSLTREEGAVFNEMLVGMGAATEGAGATQKALAEQAKSTAFQFEILKNNVQALGIQVGSVLLPPLNQLMGMLTPIVQKVAETAKAFLEAHPQVGAIALAIGGLVAAAGPVLMIFGTLATVVGALLSPLGLLVGVVVGLAAAWMTNFGGIRDAVQGAWSAIEPIFKLIISFIGELVKAFQSGGLQGALTTWEALWPKFSAAVTGWIGPVIPTLLAKLGELASRMLSWVAEQISPLLAQLAKWGQQFVDWIGPKIPPLLAELAKLAGQLLSWVASQIPPLLAQLA